MDPSPGSPGSKRQAVHRGSLRKQDGTLHTQERRRTGTETKEDRLNPLGEAGRWREVKPIRAEYHTEAGSV